VSIVFKSSYTLVRIFKACSYMIIRVVNSLSFLLFLHISINELSLSRVFSMTIFVFFKIPSHFSYSCISIISSGANPYGNAARLSHSSTPASQLSCGSISPVRSCAVSLDILCLSTPLLLSWTNDLIMPHGLRFLPCEPVRFI